jgi:hypothetical protein
VDTDVSFDAGEGEDDEGMGDVELEVSGFAGSTAKTPEDLACDVAPPSPDAIGFVLAARTPEDAISKPADASADP